MRATFVETFGPGDDITVARAPGRVNLIGEHTDYNDGFVLPMTIDRTLRVALRPRTDTKVAACSLELGRRVDMRVDGGRLPKGFGCYVGGTLRTLHGRGLVDRGADVLIGGDVPRGAGLSSSAALCAGIVTAAAGAFGFELGALDAAHLCREIEHRYAGVRCGIMDPLAILAGRSGQALAIDCRTHELRHVPLPLDEHRIVVVDSGVRRGLATSAYNDRRAECESALGRLRAYAPDLVALRDVTLQLLAAHGAALTEVEHRRTRHVVSENARVLESIERLEQGDIPGFGKAMIASHASLRDDYAVSHPALDRLVDAALGVDGVVGARMTGAGFGGCTVQLVRRDAFDAFDATMHETLADLGHGGTVLPIDASRETGLVHE